MSDVQTGTITTQVPARLDRLPWSRFHWRVVIGLGAVWILDGLEVTMVASVAARWTQEGSGIAITATQVGIAGAIYIAGACLGALFFGQLTDRFGRKKLFIATLALYLTATVATAFTFSPWFLYICRFFTGAGIGGEYGAINSAIDELIPARVRGRVDLIINGSYWLGSAAGSGLALVLLNEAWFPTNVGWRLAFGLGAVLGLVVLLVRRNVPESPRWLFIHGREDEAERIVGGIEDNVREETDQELADPEDSMTVRQRKSIPFREIAQVAFVKYPKRSVLCLALFVGQAFLYNGITFNLGTLLTTFYGVAAGLTPLFIIFWALSNFAGPVVLGRWFDTVGRKPMISLSYLGSAAVAVLLALVFVTQAGGLLAFMALLVVCFFLASSGASAAYLTVSEIFPMETRALAIAFFYAAGTAVGGISGPLLFGSLIGSGERPYVAIAFLIGATIMAVGGVVELLFGVKAEGKKLEDVTAPLTMADTEQSEQPGETAEQTAATPDEAAEPPPGEDTARRTSEERMSARARRRDEADAGVRRFRPGPRGAGYSVWMEPPPADAPETALDQEIETIANALAVRGPMTRSELSVEVAARYWGPGELRRAVREALAEGRAVRVGRDRIGPAEDRT